MTHRPGSTILSQVNVTHILRSSVYRSTKQLAISKMLRLRSRPGYRCAGGDRAEKSRAWALSTRRRRADREAYGCAFCAPFLFKILLCMPNLVSVTYLLCFRADMSTFAVISYSPAVWYIGHYPDCGKNQNYGLCVWNITRGTQLYTDSAMNSANPSGTQPPPRLTVQRTSETNQP